VELFASGGKEMRRTLQFVKCLLIIIFVLVAAPLTRAQVIEALHGEDTPKVEIFGGYSYLGANTVTSGTRLNLNGAMGSAAYNLNSWLGLVGDLGYYHQGNVPGSGLSLTISTYQFGPRISMRRNDHLVPFMQVLVGVGRAGGSLYTTSLGSGVAPLGTNNSFLLTAGGGADWKVNRTIGIRLIQAEYLYSRFRNGNGNTQNNLRLSAGVVFSFGGR
jgi:hypothetical protein